MAQNHQDRKKVTIYLPPDVVKDLEQMQAQLQANSENNIEKSRVVEYAVRFFYKEKFGGRSGK